MECQHVHRWVDSLCTRCGSAHTLTRAHPGDSFCLSDRINAIPDRGNRAIGSRSTHGNPRCQWASCSPTLSKPKLFSSSYSSSRCHIFPNIGDRRSTAIPVPTHPDQVLWVPDLTGSICFVVASAMFFSLRYPIQHRKGNPISDRTLALLNIWGSLFFVASAIGAYAPALTGESLYPKLANIGTFIGAILFLISSVPGLPLRKPDRENNDTAGPRASNGEG